MAKNNEKKEKIVDFKKIGAIIEKNFIVMTRDKIRLLPLMLFPIVMILVLGFTSGNTPKHIPAAIVIYDDSLMSHNIQQQIYNSQIFSVKYIVSTEDEAKRLLDLGKVSVIIEIPPKLGDDIDNNIPTNIIVIVDESDAAISATSSQALAQITNNAANIISLQKLEGYQQSVDSAASSLNSFASNQQNQYVMITDRTAAASAYLDNAQALNKQTTDIMSLSIPSSSAVAIPENSTIIYQNKRINLSDINTIYVANPIAVQLRMQIASIKRTSALTGAANANIHAAQAIATQSSKNQQMLQQNYDSLVRKPIITIQMFTKSNAENIIRPISIQNKPAYGSGLKAIDFLIPSLIALTLFQGAVMGMGRSVAGEKRDGSLTRVFLTPTSNITIIIGTLAFYVFFELCRAAFLILFAIVVFNIKIQGSILLIALILILYIIISTSVGMLISSLVKTEQQFQAMAMLISLPTIFLSGAFFPLQAMPKVMQVIANFLPITYAANALRAVMVKALPLSMISYPILMLVVFLVICIAGVITVFKRDIE